MNHLGSFLGWLPRTHAFILLRGTLLGTLISLHTVATISPSNNWRNPAIPSRACRDPWSGKKHTSLARRVLSDLLFFWWAFSCKGQKEEKIESLIEPKRRAICILLLEWSEHPTLAMKSFWLFSLSENIAFVLARLAGWEDKKIHAQAVPQRSSMRRLHGISLNLYSSSRKGVEYNLCERCVRPQASESLLTLVQDFEWETLVRVKARGL